MDLSNEAILMKDLTAEKLKKKRLRASRKSVKALKGELLIAIPGDKLVPRNDGGRPHNYQFAKKAAVSLRAEPDEVKPLNKHAFALLEAIEANPSRYSVFLEKLDWGLSLRENSKVYVIVKPQASPSKAMVRWSGELGHQQGTCFGVEIMEEAFRGQGTTDGTFQGKRYFTCQDNCGLFVTLDKLSTGPENTKIVAEQFGASESELMDEQRKALKQASERRKKEQKKEGLPDDVNLKEQVEAMRQYERENEEKMRARALQNVPTTPTPHPRDGCPSSAEISGAVFPAMLRHSSSCIDTSHDGGLFTQTQQPFQYGHAYYPQYSSPLPPMRQRVKRHYEPIAGLIDPGESDRTLSLAIGSMVQVSDPPHYGVLRWIGNFVEISGTHAGVELEEELSGCSDGSRNGVQYFTCQPGRGFFCPLSSLRPDERFTSPGESPGVRNPLWQIPEEESIDQYGEDIDASKYIGDERGIQGHQNSCYLDATVFGLFAVSDVFDSMFLEAPPDPVLKDISEILRKKIVNPLRKHGVVRFESVMALRNKLEEIGKMKGVNQDEKDPEEFLNMLFKHVLHVEPFITIRRPFGVEQEYFVQLFLEFDERVPIPSVGSLLTKMFKEQNISFTKVPSKLLIQVPRYGKKFKTYDKIVPDLQLDMGGLLPSPYKCLVCSEPARNKCNSCLPNGSGNSIYFCDVCCGRAHSEATNRGNHRVERANTNTCYLQLLSVICIETCHYVCFTHTKGRWIFMDSMADRVHDTYNIPKGVDCTQDLNEWVYTQDRSQLSSTPPRELVRRFTQDLHMCVYVNPDLDMYDGGSVNPELITYQLPHLHELSQPLEPHQSQQKEQDLQMKLQQSQQKEQDLQMELQQAQQKEQDLQMELQQTHQKEQDLQMELQQSQKTEQDLLTQSWNIKQDLQMKLQQNERALQQQLAQSQQTEQDLQSQLQQSQQTEQDLQRQLQLKEQDHRRQLAQSRQTEQDLQTQLQLKEQDFRRQLQHQASSRELEFWNVSRTDIEKVDEIGRGGWGIIFKSMFQGRTVAVKQLHHHILSKDHVQRLRREVCMMAKVRHPNLLLFIAAVFDDEVERLRSPPLIVMELLDIDLRKAYETKQIISRDKIPIFRDVAYALNYLHNCREPIIHRDVSAPNVLLEALANKRWKAKVSDFGSANLAEFAKTAAEGAIIYSAPETFPEEVHVPNAPNFPQTPKIDVYSYGVLLCEVITCKLPDKLKHMKAEVQQSWPFMHSLITSCTNYYPHDRPTISQVLKELQKLP